MEQLEAAGLRFVGKDESGQRMEVGSCSCAALVHSQHSMPLTPPMKSTQLPAVDAAVRLKWEKYRWLV